MGEQEGNCKWLEVGQDEGSGLGLGMRQTLLNCADWVGLVE